MPKYSTWHCFSCSNPGSCDCHSLHASKCWHLEMAAASNNAFCPEEIISGRVNCKLRCCTSSLQGRDGDSVWLMPLIWSWKGNVSLVQASAEHSNFNLCLPLLDKEKSTLMVSSFGSTSSPQILFPHFLFSSNLLHLLHPPGQEPTSKEPGQSVFLMKDVDCPALRRSGDTGCGAVLQPVKKRAAGPEKCPYFLPKLVKTSLKYSHFQNSCPSL